MSGPVAARGAERRYYSPNSSGTIGNVNGIGGAKDESGGKQALPRQIESDLRSDEAAQASIGAALDSNAAPLSGNVAFLYRNIPAQSRNGMALRSAVTMQRSGASAQYSNKAALLNFAPPQTSAGVNLLSAVSSRASIRGNLSSAVAFRSSNAALRVPFSEAKNNNQNPRR